MKWLIKLGIRGYQRFLSPPLKWVVTGSPQGALCRFQPTCSHYCEEAVHAHGVWKGLQLALRRLLRCHPWGGYGYDPVPPASAPARGLTSSAKDSSRFPPPPQDTAP